MPRRILTLAEHVNAILVEQTTTEVSLVVSLHDGFAIDTLFSVTDSIDSVNAHDTTSISTELDKGNISGMLWQAFERNGITVSGSASVAAEEESIRWRIDDSSRIYLVLKKGDDNLYICTRGKRPMGGVRVFLKEWDRQPIQNLSGYYVFTDVKDGDYTIQVSSDYYFDEQKAVTLPLSDPRNPVESVVLRPVPFYPFPPGATLVKGLVRDVNAQPIPAAKVKVLEKVIESQTTDRGEFVLYFIGLTEGDIWSPKDKGEGDTERFSRKRYIKADGGKILTLEVTHPNYVAKQVQLEVEEGKTNSVFIENVEPIRR